MIDITKSIVGIKKENHDFDHITNQVVIVEGLDELPIFWAIIVWIVISLISIIKFIFSVKSD